MLKNLARLQCSGDDFYLLTTWHENFQGGITVTLCDMVKAYTGTLTEEDFIKLSEKAKMDLMEYKIQTLKAMVCENKERLDYDVRDLGAGIMQLIWKRVIEDKDIKIQLGSVMLEQERDSISVIRILFDNAIELIDQQKKQMAALTMERDYLIRDKTAALKNLEKYVSVKEDTEKDLYSKFVVVLNDKKAKLRDLKARLAAVSAETSSSQKSDRVLEAMESSSWESHGKASTSLPISEDSEYETDDEHIQRTSTNNLVVTRGNVNEHDDDLVLDDQIGPDDDVPIETKRPRKTTNVSRNPSSKPVILKVPSSEARQSSDRQGFNQQKSASSSSSYNSHMTDDLIEDMD